MKYKLKIKNNMAFTIGQKVVCKDTGRGYPLGIVKGRTYIISGFDECEFCGAKLVLLANVDSGSRKSCLCSNEVRIMPTNAFYADRFEPLMKEKKQNVIKEKMTHFIFN